ncbi:O-acetyl-ADP-ribose deacetylase (regulator of RNase III) [Micromonospora profundi]|uniref:macro domain-containing protein n=1 Tax=Micromonospora profundi TaxID=1420889 RepID=UPI0014399E5A|nr:macro domain-containing protein [Micromonospora profundi]NJC12950.1 O-acetyl-ADP-ribose deacetylase (regulator of RNase III) [Micromonospora profundi]
MNVALLGTAGVFLALALTTLIWAVAGRAVGRRHTVLVATWLCMALGATLVIFSFFPTSSAEGTVFGWSLGGAGAFVLLIWTGALRAARQAEPRDAKDMEIRRQDEQIARLTERLTMLGADCGPRIVPGRRKIDYRLTGNSRRRFGIIVGDIRLVTDVDVWVSSENTDMEMSRFYERSLSAIFRYGGARRDEAGHVIDDCVDAELSAKVAGRRPVVPGTAISTTSGELSRSNKVKYLIHVAAVSGEPGHGYRQVGNIALCAKNALAEAEGLPDVASVVLPLFGAGAAGADIQATVRAVSAVVAEHLERATARIRTVYLLAYTDAELAACSAVLNGMPELRPPSR